MSKEQEWKAMRLGNFTASSIWKLFTEPKLKSDKEAGKLSETALTYINDKAAELLTGLQSDEVFSKAIEWGNENEPRAVEHYQSLNPDYLIEYFGKENPKYFPYTDFSGASPDMTASSIASSSAIFHIAEIKCPFNSSVHIDHLRLKSGDELKEYKKEYWYQIQFQIVCVAMEQVVDQQSLTCDFISYDPRFQEPRLRMKILTVEPCKEFQKQIAEKIHKAEKELRNILNDLGI